MRPALRSRAQRKADTLALLRTEVDCWVASADEMENAHLVPLSHYWDGAAALVITGPVLSAALGRDTSTWDYVTLAWFAASFAPEV